MREDFFLTNKELIMKRKSTWEKFFDKINKIDEEDFTEEEKKNMDNALIIRAKDKFLSGWGPCEGRTCYQVIVCFDQKTFYNIIDSLENDNTFSHIYRYRHIEDFLKSYPRGLTTAKNGRLCPAWNKSN